MKRIARTGGRACRSPPASIVWSWIVVVIALPPGEPCHAWLAKNRPAEAVAATRAEAGVGPGGRVPRLAPPEFGQASPARFRAEAEFYIGVEHRFFAGMQRLLRDELGVQAPVVGTADHSDRTPAYAHSATPSRFGAAVPY